jgi:hypothetical protein
MAFLVAEFAPMLSLSATDRATLRSLSPLNGIVFTRPDQTWTQRWTSGSTSTQRPTQHGSAAAGVQMGEPGPGGTHGLHEPFWQVFSSPQGVPFGFFRLQWPCFFFRHAGQCFALTSWVIRAGTMAPPKLVASPARRRRRVAPTIKDCVKASNDLAFMLALLCGSPSGRARYCTPITRAMTSCRQVQSVGRAAELSIVPLDPATARASRGTWSQLARLDIQQTAL